MTVYQRFPIHDPRVNILGCLDEPHFMHLISDILECHVVVVSRHQFSEAINPDTYMSLNFDP